MNEAMALVITYTVPFGVAVVVMCALVWGVVYVYECMKDVDTQREKHLQLYVLTKAGIVHVHSINGQDHAHELLRAYPFNNIVDATVRDPINGETIARMDSSGRLIAA